MTEAPDILEKLEYLSSACVSLDDSVAALVAHVRLEAVARDCKPLAALVASRT